MTTEPGIAEIPDSELLSRYAHLRTEIGMLEQEIYRRLGERKAIAIPDDKYRCELRVTHTYDQSKFAPLKEILSQADLATCWFPYHIEVVQIPEKWNTIKVLALARRYGETALNITNQARIPSSRSLIFKERSEVEA